MKIASSGKPSGYSGMGGMPHEVSERENEISAKTTFDRVAFFVDWWRKKGKVEGVTFEQLPGKSGFALDFEGNKVVAVKLDQATAREIAGEAKIEATGAGGGASYKTEAATGWLFVTNRQNPMIYNGLDRLLELGSKVLTNASGSQVLPSNITVSATSSVTAKCLHCGIILSPNHVGPCPSCGKEGKKISVALNESVGVKDSVDGTNCPARER